MWLVDEKQGSKCVKPEASLENLTTIRYEKFPENVWFSLMCRQSGLDAKSLLKAEDTRPVV